jgi:hypothetical protein
MPGLLKEQADRGNRWCAQLLPSNLPIACEKAENT